MTCPPPTAARRGRRRRQRPRRRPRVDQHQWSDFALSHAVPADGNLRTRYAVVAPCVVHDVQGGVRVEVHVVARHSQYGVGVIRVRHGRHRLGRTLQRLAGTGRLHDPVPRLARVLRVHGVARPASRDCSIAEHCWAAEMDGRRPDADDVLRSWQRLLRCLAGLALAAGHAAWRSALRVARLGGLVYGNASLDDRGISGRVTDDHVRRLVRRVRRSQCIGGHRPYVDPPRRIPRRRSSGPSNRRRLRVS
jgi:hypothetical protein